jgi:hypothetical protein
MVHARCSLGLVTDMFEFMAEITIKTVGKLICCLIVYHYLKTHFLRELLITKDTAQLEQTGRRCCLIYKQIFFYLTAE